MKNKHKVAPFESFSSSKGEVILKKTQEIVDGKAVAVIMAIVTI